ncbi:MAG TPA: hypothetical protein VF608_05060, partial [Thermoanaerobaculia bacterium]
GWAKIVASAEEIEPEHQNALLVYGKRLNEDEPATGHAFMRAYLRGVRQYNQGKTDRNVAILTKHTKLDEPIVRNMCWTAFYDDGRIRPERVQPFLDWALQQKLLDAPMTVAQWWNPAFVEAAQKDR